MLVGHFMSLSVQDYRYAVTSTYQVNASFNWTQALIEARNIYNLRWKLPGQYW